MSSSDGVLQARASADAMAFDEAAAITAGYARGNFTIYYVDCTKLPNSGTAATSAAPGSVASSSAGQCGVQAASLLTLGDFSMLPHPEYTAHRGKVVNKPLYLHHLKS
ncbi:hypothetical protein NXY56_004425 [Leishmania guyanensis]|uniref:Uncharacterized protein n=3 Tax=Viannia TaxID=37616 RepID=A0AAW3BLX5_9TRYP|nr:unnamed protein product [Leishmania braziliensis]CAJ2476369.1 unnamed protein product [Leishmania braziliensis]SYZ67363.1 hypothetical_protein [Leishmania braziliensis MHOM/BR/75/M2904]